MALDAGVLTITVEFAQGLKDQDWFGKQDPYAIVRCGGQVFRTKTHTDGGRNPVWNQTFTFNVINENSIDIDIKDEDTMSRDDLIGNATFTLARVREHGSDRIQAPVVSKRSKKQYGFVSVALKYQSNSTLRQKPAVQQQQQQQQQQQPAMYAYPHPAPPMAAPYGYAMPPPPYGYAPAPPAAYHPGYAQPPMPYPGYAPMAPPPPAVYPPPQWQADYPPQQRA